MSGSRIFDSVRGEPADAVAAATRDSMRFPGAVADAGAAVRDQILAKLSTDQQASVKDCLASSRRGPGAAGFRGRD